jgi:hypothetical protein
MFTGFEPPLHILNANRPGRLISQSILVYAAKEVDGVTTDTNRALKGGELDPFLVLAAFIPEGARLKDGR